MTRWVAGPHLHRRLAHERLVAPVDPRAGEPFRLNSTAAAIWDLLQTPRSVDAIVTELRAPAPADQVAADVETLLRQLVAVGVVAEAAAADHRTRRAKSVRPDTPTVGAATSGELWKRLVAFTPTPSDECVSLARFGPDTQALIEDVERMGCLGQLAHAIDLGHLSAEVDERALIQERWAANQMHCLRVEQMLLVALGRLDEAGIPHRLLKGVAVAHLDHPDPSWREFGDADVLIPEDAWVDAVAVLGGSGDFNPMWGGAAHPFTESKGLSFITSDLLTLDLHKRLGLAGLGHGSPDTLFDTGERFMLGGVRVDAIDRAARLTHALLHLFASRSVRRGTVRDFVELADADVVEVFERSAALGVRGAVRAAALDVAHLLDMPSLRHLADNLHPSWRERFAAARIGRHTLHHTMILREILGLVVTPGAKVKADYARSRLVPDAAYRAARGVTWRTYADVLTGHRFR